MMFLRSMIGQVAVVSMAGLLIAGWVRIRSGIEEKAVQGVVRESNKQGAANAAKSKKAHDRARTPGAVDRLRSDPKTCPDCSR